MKYIKIVFFICAIHTLFSLKMSAQDNKIIVSAVVLDTKGNNIPGAIIVDDNDQTVTANDSGEFSLSANVNSSLLIKVPGYKTSTVQVKSDLKTIVLQAESSNMVNVAFNKVDKADILGGVSNVNIAGMLNTNYSIFSLDNLASFIPGYHGNGIWGTNNRLVIVDGVPRDEFNVMPFEIDDITVLKSAAAVALYGSRAAKGVISITTKRGTAKKSKFDVRLNHSLYVPKRYAEFLGSAEYMTLFNEALRNDARITNSTPSGLYSDEEIANYAAGTNPFRYPDLDFYSFKNVNKFATRSEIVTEYTGGTESAQFYVNIGNFNSTSLLDIGNGKKEGENRFNVRGNLDIKINDMISTKINTNVTFYDNETAQGNFWGAAATLRPNLIAPLIPLSYLGNLDAASQARLSSNPFIIDGQYILGGTQTQATNPFADIYTRGTRQATTRKYQFDATINFDLARVLKGLSFDTQFAIDYNTSYAQNISDNTYAVYVPTWTGDKITELNQVGTNVNNNSRTLEASYQRQTLFFSGAFKYKNTFNKVHNVSSMLVAHGYKLAESQVYHAIGSANLGFQAAYNFKQKYYLDFTANQVHSARFAEGNRGAFSPTASIGWRISNEDFLANATFIDDLKLTASAGILNTDLDFESLITGNGAYFLDRDVYSTNNGAYFSWQEGRQLRATDIQRVGNPDLTYQKRKEISFGLESSLFKNSLQFSASYFVHELTGIPINDINLYPSFMAGQFPSPSSFVPYVNYNADNRQGFDLGISFNKRMNKVDLNVGMVATYYKADAGLRNDITFEEAYQKRQGMPIDALWGLKSDGFYSEQDIIENNYPTPTFGNVTAGDIKYVDVNNDGLVDNNDQVYLGRQGVSGSPLTLGLNVTAKWKNFSLFVLANRTSGSVGIKGGSYYWPTAGVNAKYSAALRDRWTPETAETATYPRLTTTAGNNNYKVSDFWLFKNDRINLARVQLSYDLPKEYLEGTFISNVGFYINGNDLLLISKERKHMETSFTGYPQMRVFSMGLTAAF